MTARPLLAAALSLPVLVLAACGGDDDAAEATAPRPEPTPAAVADVEVSTPATDYDRVDPDRLERERLDRSWYEAAETDRRRRTETGREEAGGSSEAPIGRLRSASGASSAAATRPTPGSGGTDSSAGSESWEDLSPDAFGGEPALPIDSESAGPTVFRLQWMLDRASFSPGVIDGRWGKNTEKAVYWLQDELGLETTGTPDRALWDRLASVVGSDRPVRRYTVTSDDVDGPYVEIPDEPSAKAELDCLCYASLEEALADRFHTTREALRQLNDGDIGGLAAGDSVWVPAVDDVDRNGSVAEDVGEIVVSKSGFYLHALDDAGRILYHFPTTVGAGYDPSPSGDFSVTAVAYDPTFHYQPKLFSDVPDTDEDAMFPAGPNSPVGEVWMQLSKDNYGIHGTAAPETIGYTTSHGCVRLTNWDALFLANRTPQGTPVRFTD